MTSSYSGPYQSRVFRFLSQNSRRFLDTWERGWRRVKVAADNVAQYVLYPVYVVLQFSRQVGKQMGHAGTPESPPLPADRDTEGSVKVEVPGEILTTNLEIDYLEPATSEPSHFNLQPLAATAQFRPARQFWQLMAWVQTSPLAVRVNLFQEATLVQTSPVSPQSDPIFTQLDRLIAKWEMDPLTKVSKITTDPENDRKITGVTSGIIHRIQGNFTAFIQTSQTTLKNVIDDTPDLEAGRIKALIQAAIHYFFGEKPDSSLTGTEADPSILETREIAHQALTGQQAPTPLPAPDLTLDLKHDIETSLATDQGVIAWEGWQSLAQGVPVTTTHKPEPVFHSVASATTVLTTTIPVTPETTVQELVPDYWETEVTAMEYVKHPLEQLLQWLDRGMVWLEKVMVKVWHWIQEKKEPFLDIIKRM